MGRQQGIAGHSWPHLAIAENEVGEDREHGFAPRTLEPPDGDCAQADTHVMGVARQAPTAATGRLVLELKAKGHDEGDDTFAERLPIAKQLEIRRFAPEIDGNSPVFAGRFGRCAHVLPPGHQVS